MNSFPSDRDAPLLSHLGAMQEQLQNAIGALAANSLADFENSLWHQEMLCANLRRAAAPMLQGGGSGRASARVQAAVLSLHHLNRTYAELVQHAAQTNRALQDVNAAFTPVVSPAVMPAVATAATPVAASAARVATSTRARLSCEA